MNLQFLQIIISDYILAFAWLAVVAISLFVFLGLLLKQRESKTNKREKIFTLSSIYLIAILLAVGEFYFGLENDLYKNPVFSLGSILVLTTFIITLATRGHFKTRISEEEALDTDEEDEKMGRHSKNPNYLAKFRIIVPTEKDKEEIQRASRHIHSSNIDTDFTAVNQLAHQYLNSEEEGEENNIVVDADLYEILKGS